MLRRKDTGKDVMSMFEGIDDAEATETGSGEATASTAEAQADGSGIAEGADEQSVQDFLNELNRERPHSRAGRGARSTPAPLAPAEKAGPAAEAEATTTTPADNEGDKPTGETKVTDDVQNEAATTAPGDAPQGSYGWGWSQIGGILGQASAAMKTAEQRVREIQQSDDRKRWEEKMRNMMSQEQLSKLDINGLSVARLTSTLNSVLSAVAPPIAAHEVLKVSIFHDMVGYPDLENMIYTVFERVMTQVEGGELVVQKSRNGHRRDSNLERDNRDLSMVEGLENATKLVKANVEQAVRERLKKTEGSLSGEAKQQEIKKPDIPVHVSNICLGIQACLFTSSFYADTIATTSTGSENDEKLVCFIVYLVDPDHDLKFVTQSQSFPLVWHEWQSDAELDQQFSENAIRPSRWIAEWFEDALALAVGVVAQRYVAARMGLVKAPS